MPAFVGREGKVASMQVACEGGNRCRGRILVVEDDAGLNDVMTSFLALSGYDCTSAFSGSEAYLILKSAAQGRMPRFDLVLCDLMLPGLPGEELIEVMQEGGHIPVIVISAKSGVPDRVRTLRLGADDYLVKPFDLDELLARVEVRLRRGCAHGVCGDNAKDEDLLTYGRWVVDFRRRGLLVDGRDVGLTKVEFAIVSLLAAHPGRVYSRADIGEIVYRDGQPRDDKTVSTHIGNIRLKLRDSGTDQYVRTVWGHGVKLEAC